MQKLILLIDDDEKDVKIMNHALKKGAIEGHCLWANGPEHAMRLLNNVWPDYIFIDINMPGMDGFACLKELKQMESLANTPMVIYSTHIDTETKTRAREQRVACMQKPDKVDVLAKQLVSFLSSHASAAIK